VFDTHDVKLGNRDHTVIIQPDDQSTAFWADIDVVASRNGIFLPSTGRDDEGLKGRRRQKLPDKFNHSLIYSEGALFTIAFLGGTRTRW